MFNILLNLFRRREHFTSTIYFIDELDVHLHTRLQHALIREVVEHWIPDYSQLWTASHSLGFIEYAGDADDAAIIDFDDLDFDRPRVLTPAPTSAAIFDIAVPRDSALKVFPNKTLVVCENRDALLYNAIGFPGPLLFRRCEGQERRRPADSSACRVPRADRPRLPRFRERSRCCVANSPSSSCSAITRLKAICSTRGTWRRRRPRDSTKPRIDS